MVNYEPFFSNNAKSMKRSEIRELLKLTTKPGIISFAGGLPAPDLFPIDDIKEISRIVMEREGKTALQYGPTEGDNRLREELAKMMQKDGANITSNHLLIVTSSQQGLDLTGKIFIDPGDVVLTSRPTYIGAIQAFHSYGAKLIGIDQDAEGTQTALLEAEIEKLATKGIKPKFIYEIPDFQNPSGITLPLKRRKELIRIAEKYNLIIIEDSPYRQLRFEGQTEPSLLGMNPDRVLGLYTFSKILLPGFRLGWMAGPNELVQKAVTAKQSVDLVFAPFQPGHPLRIPAPRPAGEADHHHHQGLPGEARFHDLHAVQVHAQASRPEVDPSQGRALPLGHTAGGHRCRRDVSRRHREAGGLRGGHGVLSRRRRTQLLPHEFLLFQQSRDRGRSQAPERCHRLLERRQGIGHHHALTLD